MAPRINKREEERLKPFRKKLRELREEQGLSQRELSSKCDVKHTKISQLEINDKSNLNLTTLFELARGLNVHPKELIDYEFDFID
tara:strand:- start:698 stop:952 length:255 start_codon:yes stop_codon:yes gene_type:complete